VASISTSRRARSFCSIEKTREEGRRRKVGPIHVHVWAAEEEEREEEEEGEERDERGFVLVRKEARASMVDWRWRSNSTICSTRKRERERKERVSEWIKEKRAFVHTSFRVEREIERDNERGRKREKRDRDKETKNKRM